MGEYDNLINALLVNQYNGIVRELHSEFEYDLEELFSEFSKSLENNTKILDNGIPTNWEDELN